MGEDLRARQTLQFATCAMLRLNARPGDHRGGAAGFSAIADDTIKFERILAWCAAHPDEVAFALHHLMRQQEKPTADAEDANSQEDFPLTPKSSPPRYNPLPESKTIVERPSGCREGSGANSASLQQLWRGGSAVNGSRVGGLVQVVFRGGRCGR